LAGIDQPPAFLDRQIAHTRSLGLFEWLDSAPSVIAWYLAVAPRPIKRGPQDCQHPIRRRSPLSIGLVVIFYDSVFLLFAFAGP
jgi:hypothetical protein